MSTNTRIGSTGHVSRRAITAALLLPAFLGGAAGAMAQAQNTPAQTAPTPAEAGAAKPMLMFVQTADDLKVDPAAGTLRLVGVSQQTLYFSDRPVRLAGHLKMADYLSEWTAKAGKDNFADDPPNATLSVYEPGKADNILAVVEISEPKVDGKDLVYRYKLIEGPMPAGGGATSLFIDWIGVGGGVGPGFHGVGVGFRGPGWR